MYTAVPWHWVRGVMWGCNPDSFDIPKLAILVLLPAMRRTFLLERSQWMMSFQWKGQGYVIAQIVLKVIGRGSFDCWVRDSSSNSISKTRRPNSGSQAIPRYCTILGVPYLTEKLTLLLKLLYDDLAVRIIELEEGRMKQFDRARKLVKHGLADIPIGPSALQCIQMNEPIYYSIESITIHHKPHSTYSAHSCLKFK